MSMPITFALIIILAIWMRYEIRKSNRYSQKGSEEFWKREREANATRKGDISNLAFIQIPLSELPMEDNLDPAVNSYRDTIRGLSGKKIVNLTGLTNTQLKLQYGVANLNILAEYDNSYAILVNTLHKWGECLYKQGHIREAVTVLEFAVSCKTDMTKTYKLLASIYTEQASPEKISHLIASVQTTKIIRKDILTDDLSRIKNS